MGLVVASWLAQLTVLLGLGLLAAKILGADHLVRIGYDAVFWVGFGVWVALLQAWNLFGPVGPVIDLILVGLAAVGWLVGRRDAAILHPEVREHPVLVVIVVAFALWMANLALGAPTHGDTGLYHLQAVRWARTFAAVPGLANLHGRLGFNSAYFLHVAALDVGPWSGRALHVANGALILMASSRCLLGCARTLRRPEHAGMRSLFDALMSFPVARHVWGLGTLTSASPDPTVFLIGAALLSWLVGLAEETDADRVGRGYVPAVVVVAATGVACKLSFLGLGVAAAGVAAWAGVRSWRQPLRQLARPLAAAALALSTWMARGLVLSGYPFYPSPALGLHLPWAVPRESVISERNWVMSWARQPHTPWEKVLGHWDWLPGWIHGLVAARHEVVHTLVPLALAGAALVVGLLLRPLHVRRPLPWPALLPLAVALSFWFVTAPDPRFAGVAFWGLSSTAVAWAVTVLGPVGRIDLRRTVAVAGAAVLALAAGRRVACGDPMIVGPAADHGAFQPTPTVALVPFSTASGLVVNVPGTGALCWDAPLPCTPYPDADLRLLHPGSLAGGFARVPADAGGAPR
jgi:hypothetical protein